MKFPLNIFLQREGQPHSNDVIVYVDYECVSVCGRIPRLDPTPVPTATPRSTLFPTPTESLSCSPTAYSSSKRFTSSKRFFVTNQF
jgi:hypothetical protein